MAKDSKIEWTDHTFNVWWGCTKVSPGCANCYAKPTAWRRQQVQWGHGRPRRIMSDAYWKEPLAWNRQAERDGVHARVFCGSMCDLFDEEAPAGQRERLWALIEATPHLDWLLLTKRPERIAECIPSHWLESPRPNVWLGTSVENQDYTWRIEELVKTPAVVHFLSVEPLLGPIPSLPLHDVEWVIVGGESGPQARPCHEPWVLDPGSVPGRKRPLPLQAVGRVGTAQRAGGPGADRALLPEGDQVEIHRGGREPNLI